MAEKEKQQPRQPMPPPQPPEMKRRVRFYRNQMVGLPLIALLPILALFKVFDTTFATTTANQNGLALSVKYPTKLRYRTFEPLEITVRNESSEEVDKVEVHLSKSFVKEFRDPTFEPDVTDVDENSYVVELEHVKAGEARTVAVDLEADFAGSHEAVVEAKAGASSVSTSFSTFVYP